MNVPEPGATVPSCESRTGAILKHRKRRMLLGLSIAGLLLVSVAGPAIAALIVGNDNANNLSGTAGSDTMRGLGGNDSLDGRGGPDWMYGNENKDILRGRSGADHMFGNSGDDALYGGPGGDQIRGGTGTDHVSGGAGNDTIWIDGDGRSDTVLCGDGADIVYVTAGDGDIADDDCESVQTFQVNDPPVGGDDAFTGAKGALANTRLVVGTTTKGPHLAVAGSVLANDTDPDTPLGLTAGPATISSASCPGCNNVSLNATGSFTYDPPAGFTGTDTFTYTVNDNDSEAPANQTDTATVSIRVFGPVVWYVDVDASAPPAGQGGRSHSPFKSLAPLTSGGSADGLDGAGDVIFLRIDSTAPITAYDGGMVLEASQKLWGEPFGLTVDPGGAGVGPGSRTLVAASGGGASANPTVRNSAAGGVGVTLAGGVEVQRVNAGITGAGSATGISGTAITTATIGTTTRIQGNAAGVVLSGAAGGNINIGAAISGNTGTTVNVADRTSGTVSFSGNITGSSANSAIILATNTDATISFSGALNLSSTGAAVTAFSATSGGTITANNAGNQIASFAGIGIGLSGVNIGAGGISFATASSAAGGAANGILLTNVGGTGAFNVAGGAITATTRALDVDGNSAIITIGASLTTSGAASRSVEVTNRTGGTVDINGLVTDSSLGINLSTNGAGLVRFDGGVVANTGANAAFSAAVSGNVAVTGSANSLTTTTGTALSVQNTTIHADDVTFRSISANGGANGILLNNTGSAGGLRVTGNGGSCTPATPICTGGTIQNTTGTDNSGATPPGTGIVLNNTQQVALTNMRIRQNTNYGIRGDDVTGFSFTNCVIDGVNGTTVSTPFNDGSINFDRISGAISITGSDISGGFQRNIKIDHPATDASATATITITGNTIHDTSSPFGDDGVGIEAENDDNYTVNVSNNSFARHGGDHISVTMVNNAVIDITMSNNTLAGGHPVGLGQGILLFGASWNGTGTYDVLNNTINGNRQGGSIHINKGSGTATLSGTISGNIIGTAGVVGSGSSEAFGIVIGSRGAGGVHTALVTGNTIRQYFDRGIVVQNGEGAADLNITVINNTVTEFADAVNSLHGIHFDIGILNTDTNDACIAVSGNSVATAGNEPQGGADIRLRKSSAAAVNVRLPGLVGSTSTDVTNLIKANNPTATTVTVTGAGFTGGAAACALP